MVRRYCGCLVLLVAALMFSKVSYAQKIVPQTEQQVQLSFAPLVKEISPAVVNIYTKKRVKVRRRSLFFDDPTFKHFFGNKFAGPTTEKIQSSLGSGVIVTNDGTIITCHHVIEGAEAIKVVLADRREFDATVILVDEKTDLAVLKINEEDVDLPFINVANSDSLEVGDLVLAVGNPFGVGQTVTSGIVSAIARTTVGVSDYQFFIQTDASINPGNSGGALVTMDGKLVGVNTAIYSRSGGSNGIGFAVPSNMVNKILRSAGGDSTSRVVRAWVGLSVQPVTSDIAKALGLDRPTGALVAKLHPKGPTLKAGLKVGDVIVGVDNFEILDEHSLHFRLATYDIGGSAAFKVMRDGKKLTLNVPMVQPPELPERDLRVLQGKHPFSGMTVANLSPALAEEIGFNGYDQGVVVLNAPRGFGRNLGLHKKDVIQRINGTSIMSTKQLTELLTQKEQRWDISVKRGERIFNIIWSSN